MVTHVWAEPGKEAEIQAKLDKQPDFKQTPISGQRKPIKAFAAKKETPTKPLATRGNRIKALAGLAGKDDPAFSHVFIDESGKRATVTDGRRMFMHERPEGWGVAAGPKAVEGEKLVETSADSAALQKAAAGMAGVLEKINSRESSTVHADTRDLMRKLKNASILSENEGSKSVLLIENPDGSLAVVAHSPDVGDVQAGSIHEGYHEIGVFDPDLLRESLKWHAANRGSEARDHVGPDKPIDGRVKLSYDAEKSATTPLLIEGYNGETKSIIMPQRSDLGPDSPKPDVSGGGDADNPEPMSPASPRRAPAPSAAAASVKDTGAREAIEAIARITGVEGDQTPIRTGRIAQRKAEGIFKVKPEVIRTRTFNNIPTTAHEVAHALEKQLYGWGKGSPWDGVVGRARARELVKLGRDLYGTTKPEGGYAREGWAEFLRMHLTEPPGTAAREAPRFNKWFEDEFLPKNPEVAKRIAEAQTIARRYYDQTPVQRGMMSIRTPGKLLAVSEALKGFFSKANQIDALAPLEAMNRFVEERRGKPTQPSRNPYQLAGAFRSVAPARIRYMVEDGMLDTAGNKVGPSLHEALAPVAGHKAEFDLYLKARRAIALLTDKNGPRESGMDIGDAVDIRDQFEKKYPQFPIAADKVYAWQEGVLDYAAAASPKLAAIVDKIRAADPGDYIPMTRLFEAGEERRPALAGSGSNPGGTFNRLKGSGRETTPTTESIISTAERVVSGAHKQMVLDSILKMKDVPGIGRWIEEVPVSKVPESMGADSNVPNPTSSNPAAANSGGWMHRESGAPRIYGLGSNSATRDFSSLSSFSVTAMRDRLNSSTGTPWTISRERPFDRIG